MLTRSAQPTASKTQQRLAVSNCTVHDHWCAAARYFAAQDFSCPAFGRTTCIAGAALFALSFCTASFRTGPSDPWRPKGRLTGIAGQLWPRCVLQTASSETHCLRLLSALPYTRLLFWTSVAHCFLTPLCTNPFFAALFRTTVLALLGPLCTLILLFELSAYFDSARALPLCFLPVLNQTKLCFRRLNGDLNG